MFSKMQTLLRSAVVLILSISFGLSAAAPSLAQSDLDTLVVAVPRDITNFDPTLNSGDNATQEMLSNVYDSLITIEVVENADGTLSASETDFTGAIAERFEWSEDGSKITFTLREGLTFSNGDPLDAAAVKFTYDRIFDQQGVTSFLMDMGSVPDKDHIRVIDSLTIEMDVDVANPILLANVWQFNSAILNPNVVQPHMTSDDPYAHDWLKINTQGTENGPFRLASWEPGVQWVLERNENYWGTPARLDRIVFKIIPDSSSRLAQLVTGAVDVAYDLPLMDIQALENNPDITVHRNVSRAVVYLGMNSDVPPFDNRLVRQAISYAVPYNVIIDQVMNSYAVQLTSPIPVGTPTHTDEFFAYENNPERARELLTEAGFPDGISTTLQIPAGTQQAKELGVYLQQSLGAAGIQITIQEMPGAAHMEQMQKHTLGLFIGEWISFNNDPFYHLYFLLHSSCCNYTNYVNADLDEKIESFMLSTDTEARNAALVEAQRQIVDDAPWAFLYQPEHIFVTRSNVRGYVFHSVDTLTRYEYLYKE